MKNLSIILFILFFTFAFSQNPEWINYTSGKIITEIIEEGNYLWIGTTGGIVKLHKQTGQTEFFNKSNSGLPDNNVNVITVDGEGNKWIGTGDGLAKFDGVSWTVYNTSNSGLPTDYVRTIEIDGKGNKWIGTDGGGLAKFDGVNWTVYNTSNSGLPTDYVRTIEIDGKGNKWIGTGGGGLAKFDGVNWTVYNTSNSGLPYNDVNVITVDGEGNKWIGTDGGGLAVYREGGVVLDVVEDKYAITRDFSLLQIYPNPFNSSTTISYQLPITTKVTIEIYNILGRKVKTLVNKRENAGTYSVSFDCSNLPSGVYFCRFHARTYYDTKKLLLLK